jgi:hypothetical protein
MIKDEALRLELEALISNRRTHHYCEDTWYSCPKHEDGCANEHEGDECNCGADKANAGIDQAITAIKAALEAKDEPVAWFCKERNLVEIDCPAEDDFRSTLGWEPLYTTPPQRKPLTLGQKQRLWSSVGDKPTLKDRVNAYGLAIEAAHGIKGAA